MKVNPNDYDRMKNAPSRYKMTNRRKSKYSSDGRGKNGTFGRRSVALGKYNSAANYGHAGHSSWWD